jgi:predicted acetyltransferase
MSALRYESFTVQGAAGTFDERAAEFVRAIDYGFLDEPRGAELEIAQLDRFRAENTLLTAVYDDAQPAGSLAAGRPVATFGDYVGSVGVAQGATLPAQMVTEVTVRGTHRRRGILSAMMHGALERAKREGLPLSLLTASEGGIYGRYGFGCAAYSTEVTIRVRDGLGLRQEAAEALRAAGLTVIVPTWEAFARCYEDAFAAFQETTPGQTGHTHAYRRRAAGETNAWAIKGHDERLRPLLVLGPDGAARGFALSKFGGFKEQPTRLKIVDLGAADRLAELALWEALGATDLVEELVWREAPDDFALGWALVNQRDVSRGRRADHLWVRVLDVVDAFNSRGLGADGAVVLEVQDRLGLIAGEYTLGRDAGETVCAPGAAGAGAEAPRLSLDAEALGSLYLGTVSVSELVSYGRARVEASAPAALDALFAPSRAPRNSYTF